MINSPVYKLLIIALLIATGILLEFAGLLDAKAMLSLARQYADHWWLVLVLILLQAGLFTFAMAGSFFLWIAAPLYPPPLATFILAAGGTLGGVSAYLFSQYLTDDLIKQMEGSRTYSLLRSHDNFFTLFALRVFPGFPHSLVNYSSGILKVRMSHFIAAAILGISIKSYLYSKVIYTASTLSVQELLKLSVFGPLLLLSAFSLAGVYIQYRLGRKQ